MKTSRVSRVVHILTALQSGRNYAAGALSDLLGISRRTVFRDLKELQSIGVPYRYDAKTGGYSIDPKFFLPPIDLTLEEALSLCLLIQKLRGHLPLPFKNLAQVAALKIENNLPLQIRKHCSTALRNVSVTKDKYAPMNLLDKVFSQLQNAIVKKRKVRIDYFSLFERKLITSDLSPYHLMYNNRAWYVLAESSLHGGIRTFKLNRIKKLTTLDKCFVGGDKFDLFEYLGRAWSMIPEGRMYNIKLLFLPKVAHNVAEVQWHSTQTVTHNDDGSATAEFRVDGLEEITWWILGYGDQVQVLAPAALRKRIVKAAQNMIKLNEEI